MGWLAATVTAIVAYDVLLRLILRDTPEIRLSSARWYAAVCTTVLPLTLAVLAVLWIRKTRKHVADLVHPSCRHASGPGRPPFESVDHSEVAA